MNQRIASTLSFGGSVLAATLAAAVLAGTAHAEGPIGDIRPVVGALSRAEVQAELMRSRPEVTAYASEWTLQQSALPQASSGVTRAQVRQEYIAARDDVREMTSEHGGSGFFAQATGHAPMATMTARSTLR